MHPAKNGLDLLLALPAELRNEIYSYLLPYPLPPIIIRARYARLRWLCASRRLFNDAAPQLYRYAYFTTYLRLDPNKPHFGTVESYFHDHLRLTYGDNAPRWLTTDARNLIRYINVDVNIHFDYSAALNEPIIFNNNEVDTMVSAFSKYFSTVAQSLTNLEEICVCCFPDASPYDSMRRPPGRLRGALKGSLKDQLPASCTLRILQHSMCNDNALSPLMRIHRHKTT